MNETKVEGMFNYVVGQLKELRGGDEIVQGLSVVNSDVRGLERSCNLSFTQIVTLNKGKKDEKRVAVERGLGVKVSAPGVIEIIDEDSQRVIYDSGKAVNKAGLWPPLVQRAKAQIYSQFRL